MNLAEKFAGETDVVEDLFEGGPWPCWIQLILWPLLSARFWRDGETWQEKVGTWPKLEGSSELGDLM